MKLPENTIIYMLWVQTDLKYPNFERELIETHSCIHNTLIESFFCKKLSKIVRHLWISRSLYVCVEPGMLSQVKLSVFLVLVI